MMVACGLVTHDTRVYKYFLTIAYWHDYYPCVTLIQLTYSNKNIHVGNKPTSLSIFNFLLNRMNNQLIIISRKDIAPITMDDFLASTLGVPTL